MKKIILTMLVVMGSKWFFPVSLVAGTMSGMSVICYYNHCKRDMSKGDLPASQFQVMVRLPSKRDQVVPVLLTDLTKFIEKNPDASLHMIGNEGITDDQSWEYVVQSQVSENQIIEAHQLDDVRIDVKYRTSGLSVQPLSSKVVSSGILFSALPFGAISVWLVWFLARVARNKL